MRMGPSSFPNYALTHINVHVKYGNNPTRITHSCNSRWSMLVSLNNAEIICEVCKIHVQSKDALIIYISCHIKKNS